MVDTKLRILLISLIVLLVCCVSVYAHKEPPEHTQYSTQYFIGYGLEPAQIVEGKEQVLYLRVEDTYKDNAPAEDMRVEFGIYGMNATAFVSRILPDTDPTAPDLFIAQYEAEQIEPGKYAVKHTFPKKGSYVAIAYLFKDKQLVTKNARNVHVEPNGPSVAFWIYMLSAVLLGGYLASKSHEIQ